MIPFHQPFQLSQASKYVDSVLAKKGIASGGFYTKACERWLETCFKVRTIYMTSSCTSALEIGVALLNLSPEDEVIVPSFTYPSTANAVLIAGAKVVYCEVEPIHLTLDSQRLEVHITSKTKAIIVVHYGGVACDMDAILSIARKYELYIIEDAAQGFLSYYKGKLLGTLGDFGCLSFHGTKDVVAGEAGAFIVNNQKFQQMALTYLMKGTNQTAFLEGEINYYEWVSVGSNYAPSELAMALLYSQFERAEEIINVKKRKLKVYNDYFQTLKHAMLESYSTERKVSDSNGHLFYIIFKEIEKAKSFIQFMKIKDIQVYTHFVPLHESVMGRKFITKKHNFSVEKGLGKRLVRLPLYPSLTEKDQKYVLASLNLFFEEVG